MTAICETASRNYLGSCDNEHWLRLILVEPGEGKCFFIFFSWHELLLSLFCPFELSKYSMREGGGLTISCPLKVGTPSLQAIVHGASHMNRSSIWTQHHLGTFIWAAKKFFKELIKLASPVPCIHNFQTCNNPHDNAQPQHLPFRMAPQHFQCKSCSWTSAFLLCSLPPSSRPTPP